MGGFFSFLLLGVIVTWTSFEYFFHILFLRQRKKKTQMHDGFFPLCEPPPDVGVLAYDAYPPPSVGRIFFLCLFFITYLLKHADKRRRPSEGKR